jgi:hypothetical protein
MEVYIPLSFEEPGTSGQPGLNSRRLMLLPAKLIVSIGFE